MTSFVDGQVLTAAQLNAQTVNPADLATTTDPTKGAAMEGFNFNLNYVAATVGAVIQDDAINVMWFMTQAQRVDVKASTYLQDVTSVIQSVLNLGISLGRAVYAPGGGYLTTSGLTANAKLTFFGDGGKNTIFKLVSSVVASALTISLPDNASFIGGRISGMGFNCSGGSAVCDGFSIVTTSVNSVISQSVFKDLYITNVRNGVSINGGVYMSEFSGITVTGGVSGYGWYCPGNANTLYNKFSNLEVTNTAAGIYSYYMVSPSSIFNNLTADGCCYFAGAFTQVNGISVEGIFGATAASTYAVQANQIASIKNVAIINVPNSKCTIGIDVIGNGVEIGPIHFPDNGAGNQPNGMLNLHVNGTGTITGCKADRAIVSKLEDYLSSSILNGYVITASSDITALGLTYEEGTWTPGYAGGGWTTAPSTINASYIKIGRQVTVTLFANNGVSTAGAIVTGLPFTSRSTTAFAVAGSSNNNPGVLSGSIRTSTTQIVDIPALTLTGDFWQMTATYFI